MTIGIETKDCTALSDAELAEMADMCTDSPSRYEVGLLSKQVEAWVLITLARNIGQTVSRDEAFPRGRGHLRRHDSGPSRLRIRPRPFPAAGRSGFPSRPQ